MATKNEVKNPLSDYEMDAMWMSYRYAIGRHTGVSVFHAGNLVKAVYNRLTDDQKAFNAFDMRREVNMRLEWGYNFGLDFSFPQEVFDPVNALMEFSKRPEVKEVGLLKFLQNHWVKVSKGSNNEYVYHIEETKDKHIELYAHGLDDLIIWANAANALDRKKHHIVTTKYDGQIREQEAFELIIQRYDYDTRQSDIALHYCPIDSYLESAGRQSYLAVEYITNIN